ncbi:hypothetical protein LXT23_47535 [Pyxidicoccus sp. QH1ED-7-1]|nr:hypothetical protein [Pyxidicoccus xibeiensis]
MFLKAPKASTDPRVRSLLQKAARRGYTGVVDRALARLELNGDKTWVRSRAVVITFEECWPLASSLVINRESLSKRTCLLRVTKATKQKDAAGLGALAHAYVEGDRSMLDCVPDEHMLRMVSEALKRPPAFFEWALRQSTSEQGNAIIRAAQQYLAAATWQWDKACILAGALLSLRGDIPAVELVEAPPATFPYWVALDKHTPQGKVVLSEVAAQVKSSYRRLIWAGFYCESAQVNKLLASPWFEAEKTWRLRRAGLTVESAEELWSSVRPLIQERLASDASVLEKLVNDGPASPHVPATQTKLM